MNRVKRNDTVMIIAGKDKGKKGEVLRINLKKEQVFVKNLNLVKKSVKKSESNPNGGYITKEAPLHISNVMLFCPKCNKPVRIGYEINDKGDKKRFCKKCNYKFN